MLKNVLGRAAALLPALSAVALGCGAGAPSGSGAGVPIPSGTSEHAVTGGAPFGTGCQADYESNWQPNVGNRVWTMCSRFNQRFNDVADKRWYYNLHGGKGWWEQPSGYGDNLDSVNFFFSVTHGGAWSTTAAYAMWGSGSNALSTSMRLGTNLDVLSTYSCETLKPDGRIVTRWLPAMAGGLRYVTGSHNKLYGGDLYDNDPKDFANRMAKANTLRSAWIDGLSHWWGGKNQPAVMTVGTNPSDCFSRLNNMTAQNRLSFPRRRDGAIGYMCWSTRG